MFNRLFRSNLKSKLMFWVLTEFLFLGLIFVFNACSLHTIVGWTLLSAPLSRVIALFVRGFGN